MNKYITGKETDINLQLNGETLRQKNERERVG